MSRLIKSIAPLAIAVCLTAVVSLPATAQGNGRGRGQAREPRRSVTVELAVTATREVLAAKGFDVVRVETDDDVQIVYYRRGNRGRGRGLGPVERLVIRRSADTIVVEEAPDELRIEIGVKLGIRL